MKYIKPMALVLIAVLLTATLTTSASSGETFTPGVDLGRAMKTYPQDTVMLTAGDVSLLWGEFYYLLYSQAMQTGFTYAEVDWSELLGPDVTVAEYIKAAVIQDAEMSLVLRVGAAELGITLTDEEKREIDESIDNLIERMGGMESFEAELLAGGFMNLEVFRNLIYDDEIRSKVPEALYGLNYEGFPEEKVAEYAEINGFMRAMHILFLSQPDDPFATDAQIEATKAEALEKAQAVLDELKARKNEAGFESIFSEYALEHSEDPGSISFPEGYLFLPYEMVEEFSNTCESLAFGEMSGIVETDYGYHIILRLPVDYDAIPYGMYMQGDYYSLRMMAVFEDFGIRTEQWYDKYEIVPTRQLENLDIAKIFKWRG